MEQLEEDQGSLAAALTFVDQLRQALEMSERAGLDEAAARLRDTLAEVD